MKVLSESPRLSLLHYITLHCQAEIPLSFSNTWILEVLSPLSFASVYVIRTVLYFLQEIIQSQVLLCLDLRSRIYYVQYFTHDEHDDHDDADGRVNMRILRFFMGRRKWR